MTKTRKEDTVEDQALAGDDVAEDILPEGDTELEALRAERDEMRDRFMRALADAENARKRAEKDRPEASQYGGSKLARDLLPVYDAMRRALDTAGDEQRAAAKALIEGVELTLRELISVFTKHGMEPIMPQVGDRFDPSIIRRCSKPRCRGQRRATSSR